MILLVALVLFAISYTRTTSYVVPLLTNIWFMGDALRKGAQLALPPLELSLYGVLVQK
jgi:hypothetical protein